MRYTIRTILSAVMLLSLAGIIRPAAAQQATLDVQEKCSKQAQAAFDHMQFQNRPSAGFINHYNVKMNRCFIETEETVPVGSTIWTYRYVFDANEGKTFATYLWHTDKVKKYWEVLPVQCEVLLPSGEKKPCKSSDEFDELVKIFME